MNSPDPPPVPSTNVDQRMSATGYEETELTYNVNEEEQQKVRQQEALLEEQLRRMREDSQEKPARPVGLTPAEIEASNRFKEFLKAEYEEGGYTNTPIH